MEPLVSICIPAYNAERFIEETLNSAVSQTYPNLEIIVSDDCSQDRTFEIASRYANQRVLVIRTPHNLGMFGNFNHVIRHSSGKYILKLDADDLVTPEHIAEQVAVMEANPQVTFAHCACRLIDINGNFIGYERSLHGSFIKSGIEEWPRYVFGPRA
ncbi:MAG: glycosyltransferase, partial [Anaerolineales bacterium]|nr:glycosyltransferase [Anaerolineales bacterium]